MDIEIYESLLNLIDIFDNALLEEKEVICYKLIKRIIDGEISAREIGEQERNLAKEQLELTMEWLQCIGVTANYQEELMKIIS